MGDGDLGREMGKFWDARAREDAYFFVDSRLEYGNPATEQFWSEGEHDFQTLLDQVGAQVRAEDDAVEIGCGLGRLTRPLAARASTVRAVDVSAEMLERAQQLSPALGNVTWLVGDGTSLAGVEDASADLCISHVVFQHIPDPRITLGYIREVGRVLRPGGRAVLGVSNDRSVHEPPRLTRRQRVAGWATAIRGRAPKGQLDPAWLGSAVDLAEVRRVAEKEGMELADAANPDTQYCVLLLRKTSAK